MPNLTKETVVTGVAEDPIQDEDLEQKIQEWAALPQRGGVASTLSALRELQRSRHELKKLRQLTEDQLSELFRIQEIAPAALLLRTEAPEALKFLRGLLELLHDFLNSDQRRHPALLTVLDRLSREPCSETSKAQLQSEDPWHCPIFSNECTIRRECTNKCGQKETLKAC